MQYEQTRSWLVWNVCGACLILLCGGGFVVAAIATHETWMAVVAVVTIGVGLTLLVRLPRMSIRYDGSHLFVVGVLWSRTIPRAQIVHVDSEPHSAWVTWRTRHGRTVATPLTLLWGNRFGWLPESAAKRGRAYLRGVRRWAGVNGR